MNRNQFLQFAAFLPFVAKGLFTNKENLESSDPLLKDRVLEFVRAGHNDLPKVKEMLKEHPGLINSSWDWGDGDFEMAIGGAGHVGNREIANYLISKGARFNVFTLTMLGKMEVVRGLVDAYPPLLNSAGPHGFTLLHHAKVGGEENNELVQFLMSKGLTISKFEL